ncbi:MAG: hypothetical protein HYZ10_14345 [Ignavibacteriales bacterium]|nr:hypothetical protein [Ignavibacteriales bacterium]
MRSIAEGAMALLQQYRWPENIRELENVIEYAFVRTTKRNVIESSKLPPNLLEQSKNPLAAATTREFFPDSRERAELITTLEKFQWNKTKVASELKIGRTTLWRQMKRFGLIE